MAGRHSRSLVICHGYSSHLRFSTTILYWTRIASRLETDRHRLVAPVLPCSSVVTLPTQEKNAKRMGHGQPSGTPVVAPVVGMRCAPASCLVADIIQVHQSVRVGERRVSIGDRCNRRQKKCAYPRAVGLSSLPACSASTGEVT